MNLEKAKPSWNSVKYSTLDNPNSPIQNTSLFEFVLVDETQVTIMAISFFASAFTIVSYFNYTVITFFEATRLFALFGLAGFLLSFSLRLKLNLSVFDGLMYGGFGIAPLALALGLYYNSLGTETGYEKFKVIERDGTTLVLENDAYQDYWHIRDLHPNEVNSRYRFIQFSYVEGKLGYRFITERKMTN